MKFVNTFFTLAITATLLSCNNTKPQQEADTPIVNKETPPIEVARFKGQQVTGISVSENGRIFANFPRWRKGVTSSVIEVYENQQPTPYPNTSWNSWEIGQPVSDSVFIGVQSVVANGTKLYILDTRNPQFSGVLDAPRVFVFDLKTNELEDILELSKGSYKPKSYINDLRVDTKNNTLYFTDSAQPGLVVYNMKTKTSKRVLDGHFSTTAETDHLTFGNQKWERSVHSDGIALKNDTLYYHALSGYTLYKVPTDSLRTGTEKGITASVQKVVKTGAPDGMIFDSKGNLYLANLENQTIDMLSITGKLDTLVKGEAVKWADTFSIYNDELYYTNSRINEVTGDISDMEFTIYKTTISK